MSLPTPYYEEEGITIYCGDCREIMPNLESVDVLLSDPPWPMNTAKHRKTAGRGFMAGNEDAVGLWCDVAKSLPASLKRIVVWVSIHTDPRDFLSPLSHWPFLRSVYIRRAIPGYFGRVLVDGEMLWAVGEWPSSKPGRRVIPGGLQITYKKNDRHNGHPGPRSLLATERLLDFWVDDNEVVIDPFLGSGTTLLAAKRQGRQAVGIEIEEKYCAIAVDRLRQEVFSFS